MKYGAIILAGGKGTRFKAKKQFVEINRKAMWRYPYDKVIKFVPKNNVVVVGIDIPAGETRSISVMNGINAMSSDVERIIILEAARPLVTSDQIQRLLIDEHPSVSFVMPLVNTVIKRDGTYLNRNELYELLTPQAFDFLLLKEAYSSGKFFDMTDETKVMYEYHGIKPNLIETGENLLKVTYKRDISIIESLYKSQYDNEI